MVNLIAGEQVVPELVQHDFTAANVAAKLRKFSWRELRATGCWRA